ncbi:uncharacterized protein LOC121854685 [Homarus americanus]|uniref:Large ribosomal subunit protein uL30m n=1 Tax=Homarus americanus TaxID=6706 RepID=A0A8J5MLD6_HOMAM|nr:uncharacterized protein LOC121854685 [Homarus americanus]XP_042205320.1 uncharacterized protein LOC121854685 [Homarus americanus]KAG7155661.1 39S ribosomal protein L30-like [Homarus americanus]
MLRCAVRRLDLVTAPVGARFRSHSKVRKPRFPKLPATPVISKTSSITWSSGEVTHPAPLDCPLGNKGDYPQELPDGGRQYFGFQYYPRFPGEVDPPYKPAPLHLVTRVRCLKNKPWWDKDIMKKLGLDGKRSDYTIVKNIPEINAMLWKVKYLVKITPIRVPADLPEEVDPRCCFLKETGEFSYSHELKVEDSTLEEDPKTNATKWDRDLIDSHTRKNWNYPWQLKLC